MRIRFDTSPPARNRTMNTMRCLWTLSFPLPVRLNPSNAEFIRAWHDLYGYSHQDMSATHVAELMKNKQRINSERGDSFPAWVLDQLNIETMFPNRVALDRRVSAPRLRLVAV